MIVMFLSYTYTCFEQGKGQAAGKKPGTKNVAEEIDWRKEYYPFKSLSPPSHQFMLRQKLMQRGILCLSDPIIRFSDGVLIFFGSENYDEREYSIPQQPGRN